MQACITIRHCANDLVIWNKVVGLLHIVNETVKAVWKKFVFYNLRGCIGQIIFKTLLFERHVLCQQCKIHFDCECSDCE